VDSPLFGCCSYVTPYNHMDHLQALPGRSTGTWTGTCRCFWIVVLRGRRGTLWHSSMFHDVSKVVSCGRRNTFATFSEDALHFSWQAQHFGHLPCQFASKAQHFRRVVLRVFCESHCQGCVKSWQCANCEAGVGDCEKSLGWQAQHLVMIRPAWNVILGWIG
jgi:hypothetical protein